MMSQRKSERLTYGPLSPLAFIRFVFVVCGLMAIHLFVTSTFVFWTLLLCSVALFVAFDTVMAIVARWP